MIADNFNITVLKKKEEKKEFETPSKLMFEIFLKADSIICMEIIISIHKFTKIIRGAGF